ncbi:MAG TPA: Uma2 family endonuclease, partial [Polyangiaceae bacterium]|nr:Uma2 family endonuclease [Polyangiaceae bacterium]
MVIRDPAPEDVGASVDWSAWYLSDEDDMGEGVDQGEIIRIVLSSLGELAAQQGWQNVFLAGDNFFAWVREHPLVRVSPDVYLLDDPP